MSKPSVSDVKKVDRALARLEKILSDGVVTVKCSAKCGHSAEIEPDADYECGECGNGRLTSPLVKLGLI